MSMMEAFLPKPKKTGKRKRISSMPGMAFSPILSRREKKAVTPHRLASPLGVSPTVFRTSKSTSHSLAPVMPGMPKIPTVSSGGQKIQRNRFYRSFFFPSKTLSLKRGTDHPVSLGKTFSLNPQTLPRWGELIARRASSSGPETLTRQTLTSSSTTQFSLPLSDVSSSKSTPQVSRKKQKGRSGIHQILRQSLSGPSQKTPLSPGLSPSGGRATQVPTLQTSFPTTGGGVVLSRLLAGTSPQSSRLEKGKGKDQKESYSRDLKSVVMAPQGRNLSLRRRAPSGVASRGEKAPSGYEETPGPFSSRGLSSRRLSFRSQKGLSRRTPPLKAARLKRGVARQILSPLAYPSPSLANQIFRQMAYGNDSLKASTFPEATSSRLSPKTFSLSPPQISRVALPQSSSLPLSFMAMERKRSKSLPPVTPFASPGQSRFASLSSSRPSPALISRVKSSAKRDPRPEMASRQSSKEIPEPVTGPASSSPVYSQILTSRQKGRGISLKKSFVLSRRPLSSPLAELSRQSLKQRGSRRGKQSFYSSLFGRENLPSSPTGPEGKLSLSSSSLWSGTRVLSRLVSSLPRSSMTATKTPFPGPFSPRAKISPLIAPQLLRHQSQSWQKGIDLASPSLSSPALSRQPLSNLSESRFYQTSFAAPDLPTFSSPGRGKGLSPVLSARVLSQKKGSSPSILSREERSHSSTRDKLSQRPIQSSWKSSFYGTSFSPSQLKPSASGLPPRLSRQGKGPVAFSLNQSFSPAGLLSFQRRRVAGQKTPGPLSSTFSRTLKAEQILSRRALGKGNTGSLLLRKLLSSHQEQRESPSLSMGEGLPSPSLLAKRNTVGTQPSPRARFHQNLVALQSGRRPQKGILSPSLPVFYGELTSAPREAPSTSKNLSRILSPLKRRSPGLNMSYLPRPWHPTSTSKEKQVAKGSSREKISLTAQEKIPQSHSFFSLSGTVRSLARKTSRRSLAGSGYGRLLSQVSRSKVVSRMKIAGPGQMISAPSQKLISRVELSPFGTLYKKRKESFPSSYSPAKSTSPRPEKREPLPPRAPSPQVRPLSLRPKETSLPSEGPSIPALPSRDKAIPILARKMGISLKKIQREVKDVDESVVYLQEQAQERSESPEAIGPEEREGKKGASHQVEISEAMIRDILRRLRELLDDDLFAIGKF